jgi:ABC-type glycerol-3-phosphate transport system substrate-binding protein
MRAGGMSGGPMQPFGDDFEKNTECIAEHIEIPIPDLIERQLAEFISQTGVIDVLQIWPHAKETFAQFGYIEPLNNYIENNYPAGWWDDIPKALQEICTGDDGNVYMLPFDNDYQVFFYDKTFFDEYGVKIPKSPDEMLEAFKAGNNDKETANGGGFDMDDNGKIDYWGGYCAWPYEIEYAAWFRGHFNYYGGELFDEDLKPAINNDAGVMAIEDNIELLKYAPPGALDFGWDENTSVLTEHHAACNVQAPGVKDLFSRQGIKLGFETGMARNPCAIPVVYGNCVAIAADSKNKEEAWEFIKNYTSPDYGIPICVGDPPWGPNWMDPWRDSILESPIIKQTSWAHMIPALLESSNAPDVYPDIMIPGAPKYIETLDFYCVKALRGDMKIEDALATIEEKFLEIQKDYSS